MSTALVTYDAARAALKQASKVDDVKTIRDKAQALAAYARQRSDVELEKWVAEIKLRAEMRIGELSRDLETHPQSKGGNAKRRSTTGTPLKTEMLREAGISKASAHRAEKLAENPEAVEKYIADQAEAGKAVTITAALKALPKPKRKKKPKKVAAVPEEPPVVDEPDRPAKSDDDDAEREEAEALERAERDWKARVDKIMAADDKLAAAMKQMREQQKLIATLEVRRDGIMNEKRSATKLVEECNRQISRLEAKIKKLDAANQAFKERIAIMEEQAS